MKLYCINYIDSNKIIFIRYYNLTDAFIYIHITSLWKININYK
jgi:hypothetical protein